jgi:soluble lytic murein transglycosylase-like protein
MLSQCSYRPAKPFYGLSCLISLLLTTCLTGLSQEAQQSKQLASVGAMQASIDKQKAAVHAQTGAGGPANEFFTAPWTGPATLTPPAIVPTCTAMTDEELKPLISEAAKAQDVKPELVFAVMKRESAFYPCALSEKGALGLMQLMPEVADQFHADALDPKQNIAAGTHYLKQLMTHYKGDLRLTLAAYNAGPQRVDAENKVPDIPETTAYVDAVLKDLTGKQPAPK